MDHASGSISLALFRRELCGAPRRVPILRERIMMIFKRCNINFSNNLFLKCVQYSSRKTWSYHPVSTEEIEETSHNRLVGCVAIAQMISNGGFTKSDSPPESRPLFLHKTKDAHWLSPHGAVSGSRMWRVHLVQGWSAPLYCLSQFRRCRWTARGKQEEADIVCEMGPRCPRIAGV